ncbi:UNVERIFIED_CONTAM: hypothetical protein Sradi_1504900 [Sesamum radiatum]|uniref:Uncharacterized protein n=1 Tax=Sesamum radiatum TaxID=300843 RepID=A0AAW2U8P2_SESRA
MVYFSSPLSGRLVIAEALGKSKLSGKSPKTKEQLEKDKYLFKRRDEPNHIKTKKASSSQAAQAAHPISLDGSGLSGMLADSGIKGHMHQTSVSGISDGQHQPTNDQASIISDIISFEASRKLVEGGVKKAKVQKRRAGELNAENATPIDEEKKKKKKRKKEINIERPTGELTAENVILVEKKKKKKEIRTETRTDPVQLPLANSSGVAVEKVSEMLFDVPLDANKQLGSEKDGVTGSSSSLVEERAVDLGQVKFRQLVTDLRALALNPFHGEEREIAYLSPYIFLKYSLVYQKSLILSPPTENETSEVHSNLLPASTALHGPGDSDKSSAKLMRPSVRPDDPTKGGKKRVPPDRPEAIKKRKKLDASEDVNKKKKLVGSEEIKKKKIINESKLSAVEKKIPQRSTESQRGDMKEITEKNVPSTLTKAGKLESGRRMEQPVRVSNPTMLVMKFPTGAALPSGAELRAKFARFGPLDHSATRVFWKSYTCRLVFRQKVDAQAALKFAIGSSNLFGNANVRSYIRDVGAEAVESEPVRVQKEDSAGATQSRNSTFEHRTSAKVAVQPPQQSVQLKSCLKKPSAEEGGNGNGRGTRVKFILGGEGNTKTEQLSSFPEGTSSYTHSMDSVSKNLPTFVPQSTVTPLPAHQFQNFPINMPTAEPPPRSLNAPPTTPTNDISQQFLSLLIRCKEVVTNLTEVLGYAPYRAL